MPTSECHDFLVSEFFSMTLAATTQRSNMYAPKLTEDQRKEFHDSLREALVELATQYKRSVVDDAHVKNILHLAQSLSGKHRALLNGGEMKFGHAQKALNLYLKYLWCLELTEVPLHCPIDSIILQKIPKFTQVRWTQLTDPTEYKSIIAAAKAQAAIKGLSIAAWELQEYNTSGA